MDNKTLHEAQKRFDDLYITSAEICSDLGVSRYQLHLRRSTGRLPGVISIKGSPLGIWERSAIAPYLAAWRESLNKRGIPRAVKGAA